MRILLLGGTGQLGSAWRDRLEYEGAAFRACSSSDIDITRTGRLYNLLEAEKPDLVLNCAGYTDVDGAEEQREQAHKVNADAVGHLAEYCAGNKIRLVHYSTDYVFPGLITDRERLPDGYPEDHPPDPVNWYGMTKWRGEEGIRRQGGRYLIVRVSWLCGRHGNNFVKTMLRLSRERDHLQVVDDQWGSPTFARNVVANSLNLLRRGVKGTYHLTSRGVITWHELAEEIFRLSGREITLEAIGTDQFPTEAERPAFSKLDTSKIEGVDGTELSDWQEGLRTLLDELGELD